MLKRLFDSIFKKNTQSAQHNADWIFRQQATQRKRTVYEFLCVQNRTTPQQQCTDHELFEAFEDFLPHIEKHFSSYPKKFLEPLRYELRGVQRRFIDDPYFGENVSNFRHTLQNFILSNRIPTQPTKDLKNMAEFYAAFLTVLDDIIELKKDYPYYVSSSEFSVSHDVAI